MTKKVLTAAEILDKCTVKEAEFELASGVIKVRGLTKYAQQQARREATKGDIIDPSKLELSLFKAGVVEPRLSDSEFKQIINTMPGSVFDDIVTKISELSGIMDVDEVKQIKKS